jgi:hypothetical protein
VGEIGDGKTPLHRSGAGTATVQHFRGTTADGASADLTVSVFPNGPAAGPPSTSARSVDGHTESFAGLAMLRWASPGAGAEAWSDSLTVEQLRVLVDGLVARGDDALAGFDPPTEAAAGVGWALTAEHIATRDDTPPGSSFVSYRDPADNSRAVVVQGYSPVSGADLDLVSLLPLGQRRSLAGADRVVSDSDPGPDPLSGWTTVSWILPDGNHAVVWTRGLSDVEVAAVVGGVGRVDNARWQGLEDAVAADGWARLHLAEADLGPGHLQVPRGSRLSLMAITNTDVCLEVDDLGRLCVSVVATTDSGPRIVGPSGDVAGVPTEPAAVMASITRSGRWFVFGRNTLGGLPQVQVNGSPISVSSASTDGTVLFALEVPVGTDRLDARFPENADPITFTPPVEGHPQNQLR